MSHSTLTWFSSLIAPKCADELFVLASKTGEIFYHVYAYDTQKDAFYYKYTTSEWEVSRKEIGYWAYVPTQIDFHEKLEKQSQVQDN